MTQNTYELFENYMLSCMKDSAHDREHIYRVLYLALEIAQTEPDVDTDVLICACLLHDIGRQAQFQNPKLNHAQTGASQAFQFLLEHQFPETFAQKVSDCILSHRFRKNNPPKSIEAKILFDADKIDVSGATGIARTLLYQGHTGEPLYFLLPDGTVSDGTNDTEPSFFQEYKFKLEHIYEHFYTQKGAAIARQRQQAAVNFYQELYRETSAAYADSKEKLAAYIQA
ncbi:MAG: HD domain-containing protein [Eubacterium sp.]|nr:HD domain-containing protein [Eubacterium sp.]